MTVHRDPNFLWQSYHPRWHAEPYTEWRKKQKGTTQPETKFPPTRTHVPTSSNCLLNSDWWWGNWFLLSLLIVFYLPCEVRGATFKIALVGPWICDPMYSKALPDLAARLAMARINKDPYLSKGYWYDYTLINEDCQTSRALARFIELEGYGSAFLGPANPGYCTSAALLVKNWNAGILSWACLKANMDDGTYPTFLRSLPLSSRVLFAVLRFFHWAHVAVVSEENEIWEATGQELAASLRTLGLPISTVITMEMDEEGPRKALEKIRAADRVRGAWLTERLKETFVFVLIYICDYPWIFILYNTYKFA